MSAAKMGGLHYENACRYPYVRRRLPRSERHHRGVAKALYQRMGEDVELIGISNGYAGLINGDWRVMEPHEFSGILTVGGTILGTKRTPFKLMRVVEEDKVDKVAAMKRNYQEMKLDCLLCLGGNGTHKTANLLAEEGLNIHRPAQDHRQ